MSKKKEEQAFRGPTRALHVGHRRTSEGEQSEPIFLTSSYAFENAQQAAARFSGEEPGNVYSRYTNPTVEAFEQRFAAIDNAESCIATASGMSAILAACMSILKAGDHSLASQSLFGTTISLFDNVLSRFAVTTHYVPLTDLNAWEQALKKHMEIKLTKK